MATLIDQVLQTNLCEFFLRIQLTSPATQLFTEDTRYETGFRIKVPKFVGLSKINFGKNSKVRYTWAGAGPLLQIQFSANLKRGAVMQD